MLLNNFFCFTYRCCLTCNVEIGKKFYDYFLTERRDSPTSQLIRNIHPHETGRDSDPTFDFYKLRLQRSGPDTNKLIDLVNSGLDYSSVMLLNIRFRRRKWNVHETKDIFDVKDVMFNCMAATNPRLNIGDYFLQIPFPRVLSQSQSLFMTYEWTHLAR